MFYFFVFYMIGYAWLIEPKAKSEKKTEKETMIQQLEGRRAEKRQTKSLSAGWPLDLGKYFYTIEAQYALESSSQPIAISEYELEKFYPEKVEGVIPSIEEIEEKLNMENEKKNENN